MSASFAPSPAFPTPAVADLNPVLLDARNIYVNQLAEVVGPYILKVVESMYADALREGSSKVLMRFQAKLTGIKLWNSTIVEEHAAAIETKHPYLGDLVAAAFVAYVKVMSSIKLRDDKPNIRLKLPTNASFVHKAFVNVAKNFYEAPRLASTPLAYEGMRAAVDKTIRDMLPIRDILKAYLGNAVDEAHTVSPALGEEEENTSDSSSSSSSDEENGESPTMFNDPGTSPAYPHPASQAAPQPVSQPALPPVLPAPVQASVTECETKTISIPPAKDDLFADADDGQTDWKHS